MPNSTFRCKGVVFLTLALACIGCWSTEPPPKTVKTLIEQARGDAMYWNGEGQTPSWSEVNLHRDFDRTAKRFAVRELGKLGPAARGAVSELHKLLSQHGDYLPGGVVPLRSDIARTMGMIDDPSSIDALINYLRIRAITPSVHTNFPDRACKMGEEFVWHLENKYYGVEDAWGKGVGPAGIIDGLVLFSDQHHEKIRAELLQLQAELEAIDLPNAWTQRAIAKGFEEFFSRGEKQQHAIRMEVIERGQLEAN